MYIARKKPCKWRRLTKPKGSIDYLLQINDKLLLQQTTYSTKATFQKKEHYLFTRMVLRLNKEIGFNFQRDIITNLLSYHRMIYIV
jgi:hypothetical protein